MSLKYGIDIESRQFIKDGFLGVNIKFNVQLSGRSHLKS